ncbi:MAG: putative Ig domain-containing protein, partial [Pseudomonadota bacterium]|nr:putative Ig domain-containing protein [Pseudomonadota bacterium]
DGSTAIAALRLNVTGAEQPPEQQRELSAQVADITGDYSYTLPERLFVDHDAGGAITYDVTLQGGVPLPDFLVFDPETRTLSFAEIPPQAGDGWRYGLEVTATEEDGQTSTAAFTLTLTDSAPILAASAYSGTPGTSFGEEIHALGNGGVLIGNGGAGVLSGGRSADYLSGGTGDDVLFGNNGSDELWGRGGNDTLGQDEGIGILDGVAGKDYIVASTDKNAAILSETLNGSEGNDRILNIGSHSSDIVDAGAGYDMVYLSLTGGTEDDPVTSVVHWETRRTFWFCQARARFLPTITPSSPISTPPKTFYICTTLRIPSWSAGTKPPTPLLRAIYSWWTIRTALPC